MKPSEVTLDNIDLIDLNDIDLSETPEREHWLYKNKKALRGVLQGLQDAKEGKISSRRNRPIKIHSYPQYDSLEDIQKIKNCVEGDVYFTKENRGYVYIEPSDWVQMYGSFEEFE